MLEKLYLTAREEKYYNELYIGTEEINDIPQPETILGMSFKGSMIWEIGNLQLFTRKNRKIFLLIIFIGILAIIGFLLLQELMRPTLVQNNKAWSPEYQDFQGITMAKVPSGCFTMGSLQGMENENPTSRVCFDSPFWIGKTEVTNGEFGSPPDTACNTNQVDKQSLVNGIGDDYPHNCVTWQEALEFCHTKGMRLPTEAEWEYAVRGPDNWLYPWGNDPIPAYAIVRTDYNNPAKAGKMLPVTSKPNDISWVGVYDMAGSLREFTSTIYDTVTINGEIRFPYPYRSDDGRESLENKGTSSDLINRNDTTTLHVVRGGGFDKGVERATGTIRRYEFFDFRWNEYGFRCAKD